MITSFGIRQVTIILFVFIFLIICGCVSSKDPRTGIEKVQADYNKWLQTNPDAGEKSIYDSLKNKQYDEAIKQCEKLREIRPDDNDIYLLEGFAYYKKRGFPSAINRFSHIIDSEKGRGDAYYFRAYNYLWSGKYKNVLSDVTSALNNKQTFDQVLRFYKNIGSKNKIAEDIKAYLYFVKAQAHYRLRETQLAMDNVNKAIELASTPVGTYYEIRGDVYSAQHKLNLAYSDFEKAVEIDPNSNRAWNRMGTINLFLGNYNKAVFQFQKANGLHPNDYILTNLSLVHWLQGNQVKAFETMGKVLRGKPNFHAFYHFAYFHHLNGDQDKALVNFKKAYKLNSDILKLRATLIKIVPASSPTRKFYQDQLKTAKAYIEQGKTPKTTANENRTPTIEITNLTIDPDPVPVNQPFDFQVNFKADIPGSSDKKISTLLYFKISQNNKMLFNSEPYSIKADNRKIKIWELHMNPVSTKGVYTIKAFVKYKDLLAEKTIELIIK